MYKKTITTALLRIVIAFIIISFLTPTDLAAQIVIRVTPDDTHQEDTIQKNQPLLLVGGSIKDHIDHEYVKGVRAELLHGDSTFADTVHVEYREDTTFHYKYAGFTANITRPGSYIVKLEHDDYQTKYVPFEIKKLHKRERYKDLTTVYLRRKPKMNEYDLEGVVIKATKLKFFMDGDTLVYDADAFNLAEGSMLDGLIKQLPGVTLEQGGVINVNGKKVDALLLNGKDFFNEDRELMLENMPAYMVKNIQSYERVPESAKGKLQEKTARKELVMDIKLKREYNRGWLANADVGGGATFFKNDKDRHDGKFLGRLFGTRFDDRSRLILFFNANNLNDYRVPGESGEWSPLTQSQGLATRYKLGGNYQIEKEDHYEYNGSANASYSDLTDENHGSSATFLENGDTYGKSLYHKRSYDWDVETQHRYAYEHPKPLGNTFKNLYVSLGSYLKYMEWNSHTESSSATFNEDVAEQLGKAWMDSIQAPNAGELMRRYAINRTLSLTKGKGHYLNSNYNLNLSTSPAYNDFISFHTYLTFGMSNRGEDAFEHYRLDYPNAEPMPTDFRNRYNPTENRSRSFSATQEVSFSLDKEYHHMMDVSYQYQYAHDVSNNPLYLLNKLEEWKDPDAHRLGTLPSMDEMLTTIDMGNSSFTRKDEQVHTPKLSYMWQSFKDDRLNYLSLQLNLPVRHERMDYRQGEQVDTLMRRTTTFLNPSLMYMYNNFTKSRSVYINYSFDNSAPQLTSLLNVRNDNNPLYITLGNPNLKNTRTQYFSFQYRDKFGKTLFNTYASFNLTDNAVASGFIYDKETGVRTVKPENVNGNWTGSISSGLDFPLDKDEKWRVRQEMSYNMNHSVDLSGTNETMVATKSVVKSNYFNDELTLTWRPSSKMEYGLNGKLNYQRSTSNRANFTNLNVFTYQYGARFQLELPWNLQVSSDLTMYSRRGYSEASMNTNELVWNARLAKRMMKGNLTIMFDGFDLLGNLSNVHRYINAQGRSETFYNVIPSYGLLHVVWRLNRQPKKNVKSD